MLTKSDSKGTICPMGECGIVAKSFDVVIKAGSEGGEITGIWTTGDKDREGDIIEIGGWDVTDFNRNPIMLYDHDTGLLPIGGVTRVWFEGTKGYFEGYFAKHQFAQDVRQLAIDGVLKTFSQRFLPVEWSYLEETGYGRRFTKQKLIEISVVPVPANVDAVVVTAKSANKPERLRLVRPERIAAWASECAKNYTTGVENGRERKGRNG